jgi:hypothetical protein
VRVLLGAMALDALEATAAHVFARLAHDDHQRHELELSAAHRAFEIWWRFLAHRHTDMFA